MSPIGTGISRALIVGAVLLGVGTLSAAPRQNKNPAKNAANKVAQKQNHMGHLQKALQDLQSADAAIKSNNAQGAQQAVHAAIVQVQDAMKAHHHRQHHNNPANALVGGIGVAQQHHRHHTHLQTALADLHKAHQQIKQGNTKRADKDVHAAAKQIREAMQQHHAGKRV